MRLKKSKFSLQPALQPYASSGSFSAPPPSSGSFLGGSGSYAPSGAYPPPAAHQVFFIISFWSPSVILIKK